MDVRAVVPDVHRSTRRSDTFEYRMFAEVAARDVMAHFG